MALRNEPGATGDMARRAFFEVMNPKASGQGVPEYAKAPVSGGQPPGPGH